MAGAYNQESLEARFKQINERLGLIEEQLSRLSGEVGIPYERASAEVPQEVADLAQSGDTLGAMKKYRELTGAGGEEAKRVVMGL